MLSFLVQYGIDSVANCRICYEPLGLYKSNNQVYCSEQCYKIAKQTKARIDVQNRVLKNITEGRVCKRCKKRVHEKGMKKYCTDCRKDMEPKPKIVKKEETKKEDLCIRCKKKPKWSSNEKTKYCADCKKIVQKKQSVERADALQKKLNNTPKEEKAGKKPVDSKWLSRGLKK